MGEPTDLNLGQLAVRKGLLLPEQLTRFLKFQEEEPSKTLGAILVERHMISQEQLDDLLQLLAGNRAKPSDYSSEPRGDTLLGKEALSRGWVTPEQLNGAIRAQGLLEARGEMKRLGEILVEKKLLTPAQVAELLKRQGKSILSCPRCGKRYNLTQGEPSKPVLCPQCKVALQREVAPRQVDAEGTFVEEFADPPPLGTVADPPPAAAAPKSAAARPASSAHYVGYRQRRKAARPGRADPTPFRVAAAGAVALAVGALLYFSSGPSRKPQAHTDPNPAGPGNEQVSHPSTRIPPVTPPDRPAPPGHAPAEARGKLDRIRAALDDKDADVAKLHREFVELRQVYDPKGEDEEFDTLDILISRRAFVAAMGPWGELQGKVDALRAENRFAEALAAVEAFPATGPSAHDVEAEKERAAATLLYAAEIFRLSVDKSARELARSGKDKDAFEKIRAARTLLPASFRAPLDDLEKRIRKYLDDRKSGLSSATLDDESAPGPATPQGPDSLRRSAAGARRLDEVKAALVQRKGRLAKQMQDLSARVAERTAKSPIDIHFDDGLELPRCQVTSCTIDGVNLKSPQVSVPFSWEALPAHIAHDIRLLGIDDKDGEAHLALGKYCLLRDLFEPAERHFKRAVDLSPALAARIPAVQVFRDRKKLFAGAWSQIGRDILRLSYDFTRPDEAKDFVSEATHAVAGGCLEISGPKTFYATLGEVQFSESVVLEVAGIQCVSATAFIGLLFRDRTGHDASVLVYVDPDATHCCIMRRAGETFAPLTDWMPMAKNASIRLKMAALELEARVGDSPVWRGAQTDFTDCSVLLGGAVEQGAGSVKFDRLKVEGKAGAEWVKKSFSRNDTLALRELEDDLRGLDKPAGAGARVVTLAVEEQLSALPAAARDPYLHAKAQIDRGDLADPMELFEAIAKAKKAAPDFPGTYYYSGKLLELLHCPQYAAIEFSNALVLEPNFAEAFGARATARYEMTHIQEAQRDLEAARRLAPDLACAYALQGRMRLAEGRRQEALDALELANALDPGDNEIRLEWKGVRNVIRGPLWKQTYQAESAHFVVRTDISPARSKFYAQHLEAIAAFYAETFHCDLQPRKADALIFETQEGYQTYAELTQEDRVESTLGYYHPLYDQLLLFEDKAQGAGQETLHVLYHEGFHQFIHAIIPQMPYWLNEGVAEYFGASEVKDGKVVRTGLVQKERLAGLQSYLKAGGEAMRFRDIMLEDPAEFYSGNVGLKYAQAWSMVHFFLQPQSTWRAVLQAYVDALRAGSSSQEAFDKTFGKADLRAAQEQWLEAVTAMTVK